jgi:hypothetical protein
MKKACFLFVLVIFSVGCKQANENQKDLNYVKIGMKMDSVEVIMRNKPINYDSKYDADSIITKLYEAPVGASGDFEIIYKKKDSTVLRIDYGD